MEAPVLEFLLLTLHRSEAPQESCKEVPCACTLLVVEEPAAGGSVADPLLEAEEPLPGPGTSVEPLEVDP